jgi:hypothetical protein
LRAEPAEVAWRLGAGESRRLEVEARFSEPPGTVVANTFVILRLTQDDVAWRLFARHRVLAEDGGRPRPICESVTVNPVGASLDS